MEQHKVVLSAKQREAWNALVDGESNEILYGGGAGGGKGQPLDALVNTPFGYRRMGDLRIGSKVSNPTGEVSEVIAIHPLGNRQLFEVAFLDKTSTEVTGDHLWLVWESHNGRKVKGKEMGGRESARIRTTEELLRLQPRRFRIPISAAIPYNDVARYSRRPIPPYLLGVVLGDGWLTENVIGFCSADKEIVEKTRQLAEFNPPSRQGNVTINNLKGGRSSKLYGHFEKFGLIGKKSHEKFIPKPYLLGTIEERWELLRGLMDTDGWADIDGDTHFCTTSPLLRDDVAELARSLGAYVTQHSKFPKFMHDGRVKCGKDAWVLRIKFRNSSLAFSLKRKMERCKLIEPQSMGKEIASIRPTRMVEAQCITVSHPNGLYLTNDVIVTHNSFIGCLWLIVMCQQYPKTRWLMGRAVLKALKESTLKTFIDLIAALGWGDIVNINQVDGNIRWDNGSEIILKDLFAYPSDPNFDSLGSTEYTGAFIDEASQISLKAKNIIMSRIRYRLDEYGLIPKLLICSNPAKNWMYSDFYKPAVERRLPKDKKFIQSLVGDNPYISPHYIESLKKLDKLTKERLLFGNWEYDDDLGKLFKYESIMNIFTNSFVRPGEKYITCDAARLGSDICTIYLWDGLRVTEVHTYKLSLGSTIRRTITELAEKGNVPRSHICIDEDGVGGFLVDEFPGCRGFVNNSSPLGKENYANLKSQCYFKLAEYVEKNMIYFAVDDIDVTTKLIEDLEQITQKNLDKDEKLAIVSKDVIKARTGRSTDYSDALMMRMIFEVGVQESYSTAKPLTTRF